MSPQRRPAGVDIESIRPSASPHRDRASNGPRSAYLLQSAMLGAWGHLRDFNYDIPRCCHVNRASAFVA